VQDADHMTLIALWDGRKGDSPGGTEHMVEAARERNARIDILETGEICGLGNPKTGTPPQGKKTRARKF